MCVKIESMLPQYVALPVNSGHLGTPVYYDLKLGGGGQCPPNVQVGGASVPPAPPPPCGAPYKVIKVL